MSAHAILRWTGAELVAAEGEPDDAPIVVADSWLVVDGSALAINLHRERFLATASQAAPNDAVTFWDAAISTLPRTGSWFPRVEVRSTPRGPELFLRVRPAPELGTSLTLSTHGGPDPRRTPHIKGPSLEVLESLRSRARDAGADDIVIVDELGHIVEGAATALAWWRGNILCLPAPELARVDSVTQRSLVAVATATGTAVSWETTTPEELDGHEIWALNALHGPRIVTRWTEGPAPAQEPGRLTAWRARLDRLRRPLPEPVLGVRA